MKALEEEWKIPIFEPAQAPRPNLTPVRPHPGGKGPRGGGAPYDNLVPSVLGDDGLKGDLTLGAGCRQRLSGLAPNGQSRC